MPKKKATQKRYKNKDQSSSGNKITRNQIKNAAVAPQLNLKSRYEELEDINEYFHTLPQAEQEWLNKYTENIVNASFSKREEDNLINLENTKELLKSYIKNLKNAKTTDQRVISFVNKYLIRSDNVPLEIIKQIFFEQEDKKIIKLVSQLKKELLSNIKDIKKREVNKVIKLIQKEAYGINNSRNRCILTKEKSYGSLNYIEELTDNDQMNFSEDEMIAVLDLKEKLSNLKKTDKNSDDSSEDS